MKRLAMSKMAGFSLIELMIALAIAAIIATIAIPSYRNFVDRSKMRTAQADLVALSVVIENEYQRLLAYPVLDANSDLAAAFPQWNPASDGALFSFTVVSGNAAYDLTATGTGSMNGCSITLDEANTRTAPGCPGGGDWL